MLDPTQSHSRVDVSSVGRLFRLARKELRETLRDRRTILTLVLMPLFVYPLLGLTFQKFLLSQATSKSLSERPEYVLGFATEEEATRFRPLLQQAEAFRQFRATRAGEEPEDAPSFSAHWPREGTADVRELTRRGVVDVGVLVGHSARRGRTAVTLVFDRASPNSEAARIAIEERLQALNEAWFRRSLRRAGITDPPPISLSRDEVETASGAAVTIATVLPFVLLLMTVTGAVYPAIDLTAGERERGTLEPLIAAPVSRTAILAAKYVAVLTVAVITAGMNLIAMTATAYSLGLDRYLFGGGLNATAISLVVALILVMAAFFSAMLLFVTSFARSFKEAQAYLIPLMLVSLAPGVASLMPDLKLTLPLAITPLLGIVLLARDLLTGDASGLMIAACVGSTLVYAIVALSLAGRAFGTDAVLYGSEGTWSDLFSRPGTGQAVPPVRAAAAGLAALIPAFLLLAPLPGRWEGISVSERLAISAVLTFLLFFLIPLFAAALSRASLRTTFPLYRPRFPAILGATFLGVTLWPFAYEIELLSLTPSRIDALRRLFEPIRAQLDAVPLWTKWLTLAVVPAFCEEWCFRGFLLSSLKARWTAWKAVLASGLVFGAFHMVVRDSLFFERFLPTAFLGVILAAVCVRTGTLWPGIVIHALHNGFLLTLAAYENELTAYGWSGGERTHLPWYWLALAAIGVLAGCLLLRQVRPMTAPAKRLRMP